MNRKKFFLLIILFTVLYIYMTSLDKIPEKIVLFQNEDYEINHLKGTYIEGKSETIIEKLLSKLTKVDSKNTGNSKLKFSAFGGFFKKDIEVSVLPIKKVILGGDAVGIRLYSKGVLVIGEAPVQGEDGIYYEEEYIVNEDGDYAHLGCFNGIKDLLRWLCIDIQEMED